MTLEQKVVSLKIGRSASGNYLLSHEEIEALERKVVSLLRAELTEVKLYLERQANEQWALFEETKNTHCKQACFLFEDAATYVDGLSRE